MTVAWKGGSGDWLTASDWSTGQAPTSNDTVTIAASGTYTLSIAAGEAAFAAAVTISDKGATLYDAGMLTIGSTLDVSLGTLSLGTDGVLDGGTLVLGSSGTFVSTGGTLQNVTLQTANGAFTWTDMTFNAVSVQGALTLGSTGDEIAAINGLSVQGAGGSTAGTINLTGTYAHLSTVGSLSLGVAGSSQGVINITGEYSELDLYGSLTGVSAINVTGKGADFYVVGNHTLNNAVLSIGGAATPTLDISQGAQSGADTLTLGSNFSVVQAGAGALLYEVQANDEIINYGTITAARSGSFSILGGNFINAGTIAISSSNTFSFGGSPADVLLNQGVITVSGANAVLNLGDSWTNTGTLTISNKAVADLYAPDTSLLTLKGGSAAGYTISGGVATAAALAVASTGSLSGYGTIAGALSNAGIVEATGGTLSIAGAVSGAGTLRIDANSAIILNGAAASQQSVVFNGASAGLTLTAAQGFAAYVTGMTTTDVIDLAGLTAVATAQANGVLAISASNGGTVDIALSSSELAQRYSVAADGAGGVKLTETIYHIAQAALTPTVSFGNHHVGDFVQQTLSLRNTAATDGLSERLDAAWLAAMGAITMGGSVSGLAAGATNSASLMLGLNTSAAGLINASAELALSSDGTGIDGFGITSLGYQTVQVTGAVYAYAGASLGSTTINFGNHHIGDLVGQALSLTNSGPNTGGYTEALDAAWLASMGAVTMGGSLTGLAAGSTDTSSLMLGLDTSMTGLINGSAELGLASDGTGIDGLGLTSLGYQTVQVTGAVYAYAGASLGSTTINFGNHHVGDLVGQALSLTNDGPNTGGYTEALDAAWLAAMGAITMGGSLSGLAAGSTDTSSLLLGLDTSMAGLINGSAELGLASDGTGIDGLGLTSLGYQTVQVTGAVYAYAAASFDSTTINFGNHHVGDAVGQALSLTNDGPNTGGYTEALDAAWLAAMGAITMGGSLGGLAAGSTDTSSLMLGLDTSMAGLINGSAELGLASDGTGIDGLGLTSLGYQTVQVTGAVYAYAAASFDSTTINFGNHHVGDAVGQALSLTNDGPNTGGYTEALDAAWLAAMGAITMGGSLSGLAAGSTDTSSLMLGLDTSMAGLINGSAELGLASDGTGIDGLGLTSLGYQTVQVTGAVYAYAAASFDSTTINFGNHHVGDAVGQALSLTNDGPNTGGYTEALDAAWLAAMGAITMGGSLSGLAAGSTDTSSLLLGLDTSMAGLINGSAELGLASDGTGIDGLGLTSLGYQTVQVTGAVYAYAGASLGSTMINFGNHHVGDLVGQALSLTNSGPNTGGYTEALDAAWLASMGAVTMGGSLTGLAAGSTDTSSLMLGLDTSMAGLINGSAELGLASDGTSIDGLGLTSLGYQTVQVTGAVYAYAAASFDSTTINFGNHHVGDLVGQALSLTNSGPNTGGYTEALDAAWLAAMGAITMGGSLSGLAAGSTDTSSLMLGLDTSMAGLIAGSAELGLASDGTGIDGLGLTSLGYQTVQVTGAVYAYAAASFDSTTINFGNHHVGDLVGQALSLTNSGPNTGGYTEALDAAWLAAMGAVTMGGSLTGLAAGSTDTSSLMLGLDTSMAGLINGSAELGLASDGTGIDGLGLTSLGYQTVQVSGAVYAYACASLGSTTINFGNHHVGDAVGQALSLTNDGPNTGGYTEALDAAWLAAMGAVTMGGSLSGLAAGSTDTSSLILGLDTSMAGLIDGSAELGLASDGTDIDGLGLTSLGYQTVQVTGAVYAYASASFDSTTIDFGNHHIGDLVGQALSLTNSGPNTGGYTEALDAAWLAAMGAVTMGGSLSGLAAGSTDTSSLMLGLDTSMAGLINGSAELGLASDGTGIDGLGLTSLGYQTVQVTGAVYAYAAASFDSTTINFGNHHIGDLVGQALSLTNSGPNTGGYTEALDAAWLAAMGAITMGGSLTGLAAGSTDNASLMLGLDTSMAGLINGSAELGLASDGSGIDGLGLTSLGYQTVQVMGAVYAYAGASLGSTTINFGNHHVGDLVGQALSLTNDGPNTGGYTEALDAAWLAAMGAITMGGSLSGLAAGSTDNSSLMLGLDTSMAGLIAGSAELGLASDGTGIDGLGLTSLGYQTVQVTGAVYAYAGASLGSTTINFGNHHVGDAVGQALSLTNDGPNTGGYTEALDAAWLASMGAVTMGGSLSGLAAGSTDTSSLMLDLDTSMAGLIAGSAELGLASDGTGIDGLGLTSLGYQTVQVTGAVYAYAGASLGSTTINFGNHHVGDLVGQALSLTNSGPNTGGYTEALDAAWLASMGRITMSGSLTGLAAGSTNNASLMLGLATAVAGLINGSAELGLASDGTGIDGLGITSLGYQTVQVTGAVYAYAAAGFGSTTINFGNHHVGDVVGQALSLTNSGPNTGGYTEALDAAWLSKTGKVTTSGALFGLLAGMTNGTTEIISLLTSATGAISGTATLGLTSDGSGIDGLGLTSLGYQIINVTGNVYAYAKATLGTKTINFGNHHVGDAVSQYISLTNSAVANGYSEALDAAFVSMGGRLFTSGTVTGLAAGQTISTAQVIGLLTSAAGAIGQYATLGFTSDGTGIDGLGLTALANQQIYVTGNIYAYTAAKLGTTTINFGAHHVGDSVSQALSVTNSGPSTSGFTEALDVAWLTATGGVMTAGTLYELIAGATNSTAEIVSLLTSSAGKIAGSATLGFASDGTGIDGLGTTTLASQTVTVTGGIYAYAAASITRTTINFGICHVGDKLSQELTVMNAAAATGGYTENLDASLGGATGSATASGKFTGLAAQGTNSTSLLMGLGSTNAGVESGTAVLTLTSDGNGIDGLGTTSLGTQIISVAGTIDYYAQMQLEEVVGGHTTALSNGATLNLGSVAMGGAALTVGLGVLNSAPGLSDLLSGSFTITGGGAPKYTNTGFNAYSGLGDGQSEQMQSVTLNTSKTGVFTEIIKFSGTGSNASGYSGALAAQTVTITGTVTAAADSAPPTGPTISYADGLVAPATGQLPQPPAMSFLTAGIDPGQPGAPDTLYNHAGQGGSPIDATSLHAVLAPCMLGFDMLGLGTECPAGAILHADGFAASAFDPFTVAHDLPWSHALL